MALSVSEIKQFIDDDISSEKKRRAKVGQDYYEAKHDILKSRLFYYNADGKLVEDKARSNIKIPHPFFTELADQLVSYILSSEENPIRAKENTDGLQDLLDEYFDDEFWVETGDLILDAYTKGFGYIYAYKNAEDRLAFQNADSMGVVEVPAKYAEDKQDHVLYWYEDGVEKGKKTVKRIQDWTKTDTTYWVQIDNGKIELDDTADYNPRPHVVFTDEETGEKMCCDFGFIPFWRLDNNKKQTSGLTPIKPIIDDYDLMQCGLSNNLADFDTPLHVVKGFEGHNDENALEELQQNLKTKKIVGVDSEGDVEIRTIDIPYQARKVKADEDEKNIYRFGMGFNSSQVGDGNITNIVIRSRYTLLDLKADKMLKRLKQLLKKIVKVVLEEINKKNGTDYQFKDIYWDFAFETMTNETENIQNEKVKAETQQIRITIILNVAANIGDEETLKAICDELDLDYEELKGQVEQLKEEKNTADAQALLKGVVTDEPPTETGSGTISE